MKVEEPRGGEGDQSRRHQEAEGVERQGGGKVKAQEGGHGPQGPAAPALVIHEEPEQAPGRMGADGGPQAEGPEGDGGRQPDLQEGIDQRLEPLRPGKVG